ncbi:MAG: polysaccharide biosynthesis tyrosine autokinase, partial [Lentisphaeria bacterium]|nr:polysaccharide biosynthesis tyrosine autokinase [Lentisphaeria bacterium]
FGITVFLALALSVGLVFLLDYLDNSLKSIDQIEQITRMEVIASIPRLKKKEILSSHQFTAVFNAANLAFNKGSKVLSVHSSMPGEGKSTISVKTAMESARTGNNVLIIDMDVRRPTVNKVLGMTMAPGIAEVVVANSAADLKSMIRETKHEHLSIITAGFFKDGPPLTSRLMNDIIDQVKDDYDFIVLDCSPITVVNESLVIADASDEILLVVRPNYSNIKMVKRAIGMLKGLNCHSVGVVANQVLRKSSIYYANKLYNKYYS